MIEFKKWIVPLAAIAAGVLLVSSSPAAEEPAAPDSPLVKLLASGRVPEARQGAVIEMIGKRGTVGDLDYIYHQAIAGSYAAGDTHQGDRCTG